MGLARAARAPTEFRLLNALGPVTVGAAAAGDAAGMAAEGRDVGRLMQVCSAGLPLGLSLTHCTLTWVG